ncbi:MAG: nucleotidyltransferase family protein [Myxococcota bacterium]
MRVGAVILAAGRGRRLGRGPKAHVDLDGRTFLEHVAERLERAGWAPRIAVLPPDGPSPHPIPGLRTVANPRPGDGPLSSVILGVDALDTPDAVLVQPVDHPRVAVEDLRRLRAALEEAPPHAARVVPSFGGRRGHPVVLTSRALAALRGVSEPASTTLRDVLVAAGDIVEVPATTDAVLRNVNTPAALRAEEAR